MSPELSKVCEANARIVTSPHLRDMISREAAKQMCKLSFKAAIESDQVKDHIIKNDERVKALVKALKETISDGHKSIQYDATASLSVIIKSKQALEAWESLGD